MNRDTSPLAPYRTAAVEAVRARIDALDFTHGELMRQQLGLSEREPSRFLAAGLCLLTAEALEGTRERSLPAATAIALIEAMMDVFRSITSASEAAPAGLRAAWGLPRTLNTGDALYALAQRCVLDLEEQGAEPKSIAEAAGIFDEACRGVSEELFEGKEDAAVSVLLSAAIMLGAITAGVASVQASRLANQGPNLASGEAADPNDTRYREAQQRIDEAVVLVKYLTVWRKQ